MTYRNLGNKAHTILHLISLCGIAAGLPVNKIAMSLAMMLGVLNVFIEADFRSYIDRILKSPLFLLIAAFWLLHIIGLAWTSDIDFAFRDIRVKLPLLVIPFLFTVKPVNQENRELLFKFFLASLLISSLVNFLMYNHILGNKVYDDVRGMSLFGSHIRYGILIAFGAVIALYQAFTNRRFLIYYIAFFLWFLFYTYYSQIISGTVALLFGLSALLFLQLYHTRRKLSILFAGALILVPIALVAWSFSLPFKSPITKKDLPSLPVRTAEGNEYIHYFVNIKDSKGNYIFINLCEKEIEREWNKVSEINYRGLDKKGQKIRFTLMRYMTSKGLKKDAVDFKKLSSEEIKKIESGIAEYEDGKTGLLARINGIRYQLLAESDPNGHSLLQRFEYWKAGWNILKSNFLFGVGTGDLQLAFNEEYTRNKSKLFEENRLRAHNTYLTVWISFGIFSLLFFYLLWKFTREMIQRKEFIGFAFIVIALGTFLIEDTLETQTGVTFFAFFYGLFLRNSAFVHSVKS